MELSMINTLIEKHIFDVKEPQSHQFTPNYAGDLNHAFKIVEYLQSHNNWKYDHTRRGDGQNFVSFIQLHDGTPGAPKMKSMEWVAKHDNLAIAICLAALLTQSIQYNKKTETFETIEIKGKFVMFNQTQ